MTATVTDERTDAYAPGASRNAAKHQVRPATRQRTDAYASVPATVTCTECGGEIPPDKNMLLIPVMNSDDGKPVCVACIAVLIERCRPYYCCHVPWEGSGVRDLGRSWRDYQHRCRRCLRLFIGALARQYCSAACGQSDRNARRGDRTADRIPRPCEVCADIFTPPRSDGRYCSSKCRQRAYRQRTRS